VLSSGWRVPIRLKSLRVENVLKYCSIGFLGVDEILDLTTSVLRMGELAVEFQRTTYCLGKVWLVVPPKACAYCRISIKDDNIEIVDKYCLED
jgi:hypothetical protein